MSADYDISGFIGRWVLLPENSVYEHGTAPISGGYEIDRRGSGLYMKMYWTNPDGVENEFGFEGVPDGKQRPFEVKDLVDQIKLECPNPRELTSRGYYQGELCMVAQRQLDERGWPCELRKWCILRTARGQPISAFIESTTKTKSRQRRLFFMFSVGKPL